ncbi:interleukin-26 [Colossoma macropomum]|uniref:interleukin-26 n=1 Tax=Colossoma macropomum TaxID=42526 RepID=UPI0018645FFE|nr:interleukin-26 [Colossoma macropomum]
MVRWTILTLLALAALIRTCSGAKNKRDAQVDCLARCIRPKMINDMMNTLKDISRSLPNVNKEQNRQQRYVPKSYMKKMNVADINKILEIYEDHVFRKLWNSETKDPKSFTHAFNTLKDSMERCKDRSQATLTRNTREMIKNMEERFKMLSADELWRAAGDFQIVLEWISFYMGKKPLPYKHLRSARR